MGVIRALLAIAVIMVHAGAIFGFSYIDGTIAVESFFIISGFYMSLILHEKYNTPRSYRLFISNRLLRLFPTYIFIIALTFLLLCLSKEPSYFTDFSRLNFFSKLYIIFENLFIIGQESALFLKFNALGSLQYASNFYMSSPPVFTLLLCPPAWSLSLELLFYFIAPFLVKRNTVFILIIMGFSFLLRTMLYTHGLFRDPWTYRFFPTEIFFFLAGVISYRIYISVDRIKLQQWGLPVLLFVISFLLLFHYVPIKFYIKQYLLYLAITLSIPFIFNYTKRSKIDRFIGELSYPAYLSHTFIITFFIPAFNRYFGLSVLNSLWAVVFTILFSILLIIFLINPIDRYRESRVGLIKK
jgi:peptidoglycan/LPS O-acetylase OafA/YrhL